MVPFKSLLCSGLPLSLVWLIIQLRWVIGTDCLNMNNVELGVDGAVCHRGGAGQLTGAAEVLGMPKSSVSQRSHASNHSSGCGCCCMHHPQAQP